MLEPGEDALVGNALRRALLRSQPKPVEENAYG